MAERDWSYATNFNQNILSIEYFGFQIIILCIDVLLFYDIVAF